MSRRVAATAAGRARAIHRTSAPPLPRRLSGPAAANRRDMDGERAGRHADPSSRGGRRRIDPRALAFADGAVAARSRMLPAPLPRRRMLALPRPRTFPAPRPQRLAYGGVAIASRVAGVAVDVSASRLMDRLVRSRIWIGIIAFGLIGIVAMQVSLLKLNSGIGRAVQTASTLERGNAALRGDISRLIAGDRIQSLAEAEGLVMPAPADVSYLRAGGPQAAAARAADRMRAPDPAVAGLAGAIVSPDLDAGVAPGAGGAASTNAPGSAAPGVSGSSPASAGAPTAAPGATGAGTRATPTANAPIAATPPPTAAPAPAGATAGAAGAPSGGALGRQATTQAP